MSDLYWLTDEQMARLEPYFPKSHGKPRVDDRRVLSGIVFVNRNGLCLIPRFDGAILSLEWKEAVWDRYVTGAPRPRTRSEQQYSDRKLRSRR
jgi:transposase